MPGPILIADDDAALRGLLVLLARRAGFEVDEATDGTVVLEKIGRKDYVVLLLDMMMPHLDGFAIVNALRSRPRRPAVIVVTAFPIGAIDDRIDADVVDAIVHKPFDIDMISSIITALAAAAEQKATDDTVRTKTRKREKAETGVCPYCEFEFSAPPADDEAYVRTSILLHLARCPKRPELKDDRDLQRLVDDISDSLARHFHNT